MSQIITKGLLSAKLIIKGFFGKSVTVIAQTLYFNIDRDESLDYDIDRTTAIDFNIDRTENLNYNITME